MIFDVIWRWAPTFVTVASVVVAMLWLGRYFRFQAIPLAALIVGSVVVGLVVVVVAFFALLSSAGS